MTPWNIQSVKGGQITKRVGPWYTLTFANISARRGAYVHKTMTVVFNQRSVKAP
jgi:hypothetical protein